MLAQDNRSTNKNSLRVSLLLLQQKVTAFQGPFLTIFANTLHQCDQMSRSFFQYLANYNKENLPNSIKICQSRFETLPKRIAKDVIIVAKVAKFRQIWSR